VSKLLPLREALSVFVKPGMDLCFASTPSRSNAAVRELARLFRGSRPGFKLSATGFHSQLHLLGALRLGRRYRGCFFGDNYPTPRPNRLYAELVAEGYDVEQWSLWSYVSALAAGAFGHPYAFTRSLTGTSLGTELEQRGELFALPDPAGGDRQLSLLRAIQPDITFLHAPLGDVSGHVAFSPPYGEGFYGALAARRGVIVTVERVVPSDVLATLPHFQALPAHRVLAICEEPFGAHPQPLHVAPAELRAFEPGYGDDYSAYRVWRSIAEEPEALAEYAARVLEAPDGARAYLEFVGPARLVSLRRAPSSLPPAPPLEAGALDASDRLVLLAGRALARRVGEAGHQAILAGIGQAFAAARLAKLLLGETGEGVELMVETGFAGVDPAAAHPFLLSAENIANAARLTSVDQMLGALCCGGVTASIGVIGAAQVDVEGNVNSSSVDGQLLVGPGGAPDIAAGAREVMVLSRAARGRLVAKADYVTSRGENVRTIVTEAGVFERRSSREPWLSRDVVPGHAGRLAELSRETGFRFVMDDSAPPAPAASPRELGLLSRLRTELRKAGGAARG
jgi:acyl CoA:acetate/3-ketoacid CoA transferase beta subunit/acyl CoA:acetate/3-ketoacid CoA transferase alpha subunit